MIWIETCFEFRVRVEFLPTQRLGWGSRLLRLVEFWLRSVWAEGCLGFRVWVEKFQLSG